MKTKRPAFAESYLTALRKYLKDDGSLEPAVATALGLEAVDLGMETLELAQVHEDALILVVSPNKGARVREALIRRASKFFAEAITPIELTHRGARVASENLKVIVAELMQRRDELTESNQELQTEISQRKELEKSLRTSEQTSEILLKKSSALQKELRLLSRRLLSVQEEERKRISRELHDLIAQTLTGINLQLALLKTKSVSDAEEFHQKIETTQQLIEKSVDIVHRFARDLRPAVLDDLGLIPALQAHLKGFMEDTGIRVSLTAFAGIEKLDSINRTMLYRVAQEALTNVAQHAKASRAEVKLYLHQNTVCMEIHDDGIGFQIDQNSYLGKQSDRLGLLGMRERVDMAGGKFRVDSAPGRETTVHVEIPYRKTNPAKKSP
ncbi:sensor histidine kinase [Akkermansiaceae bacterium]|nr:sensor histidine kinase [Akkermansiaceae bacterium]MDA7886798.1 sensor histidine kinase [bacterium]MDA7934359.1 sensor histidine kinase [Akkermansiaceae bacterium]MDB4466317.1 sensor histidine kinase [bacterium]MDB4566900.1 sensor histidine kinase [Akkermansiaceae bacterium]